MRKACVVAVHLAVLALLSLQSLELCMSVFTEEQLQQQAQGALHVPLPYHGHSLVGIVGVLASPSVCKSELLLQPLS